jgi:hypothetical protein
MVPSLRFLFCVCLLSPLGLLGQTTEPLVWGGLDPADLALRYDPEDPSAPALVLGDEFVIGFYVNNNAVELRAERHRRVKYFERFAYDQAPVTIEWYEPMEKISRLQALLFLPDGQVTKLRKKDFRTEDLGGGWQQYTLELPAVPAGAVLEYRYRLTSERLEEPPRFYFQENYPVRRKSYIASIPEWFDYLTLAEPADDILVTKRKSQYRALLPNPYNSIRAITTINELLFVAEALPPIPQESMSNNTFDHLPQVRLQLYAVEWPGYEKELVYGTWDDTAELLRADSTFGLQYQQGLNLSPLRQDWLARLAADPDPLARARRAYRLVTERLRWTSAYAAWTDRRLADVWRTGSGHSGELNLLLLATLRDLGIQAFPVLVRTRDSGVPIEGIPLLEQFDHLLVVAQIDERTLFFDAGNTYRPAGLPRIAALNNRGWLVTDQAQAWIDLSLRSSDQVIQAQLTLDSTGQSQGTLEAKMTGYYAAAAREQLQRTARTEKGPLLDALRTYYPGTEVRSRTASPADSIAAPLRISLDCRIPLGSREGDRLYIAPILFPSLDPDLATAAPRTLPLDTPYPWSEQYLLFLDLPAGYTVEALPEPVELRSPDGLVQYDCQVRQDGRRVTLKHRIAVLKTFYTAAEYEAAIRDIFITAIDQQEMVLVLRRPAPNEE